MIGIIYSNQKLERLVQRKDKYENIDFYLQLAKEHHTDLLFYSLIRINKANKTVNGYVYSYEKDSFEEQVVDIPDVNLMRTISNNLRLYHYLKKLEKEDAKVFVNLVPSRNKYGINLYLTRDQQLEEYIPKTTLLSFDSLSEYLKLYTKVIIKPTNGAKGNKIIVIEKIKNSFLIKMTNRGRQSSMVVQPLLKFYKRYFKQPKKFIIQPYIPFMDFEGRKFDIRTSVQKNEYGEWAVTGIVLRSAGEKNIVTNVAQGGYVLSYKTIEPIIDADFYEKISTLSIQIAKKIEELYPSVADLGLDTCIDKDQHLWFIEANYADERYAYRESGDIETWFRVYKTPFMYALSLSEKK